MSVLTIAGLWLPGACDRRSSSPIGAAFRWRDTEVDVGELLMGAKTAREVAFEVLGNESIQIVRVQPSCGCSHVSLWRDGVEVGPGAELAAGTTATARVQVEGTGRPGPKTVSVGVAWCPSGQGRERIAVLNLHANICQVFQAVPDLIEVPEAAPGSHVPFSITWRALDRTPTGNLLGLEAAPFLRVLSLEERKTEAGLVEVVARGQIHQTSADERLVAGVIRLRGFTPPPPDVPVKILFRPFVERSPAGLMELRAAAHGTGNLVEATATLRLSPDVCDARFVSVEVLPDTVRQRMTARLDRSAPGVWGVHLSGSVPADLRQDAGFVRVRADRPEIGELMIRWLYLRPRVRPRRRSARPWKRAVRSCP